MSGSCRRRVIRLSSRRLEHFLTTGWYGRRRRRYMEFRVLGPVEVSSGGRPLQLGGAHQRALLAFLLLHANEVVSADRLLDELWAVPPGGGVAAVRTQVSRLRKQLGDRIVTSGRGYELRVEPGELDLEQFRALLAETGASAEPARRSQLLR